MKRLGIEDVIDKMYQCIDNKDDVLLDDTFHELCREFNNISQIKDDAYTVYVQFLAMACIVRAHIYAQNSDAIEYENQMIYALNQVLVSDLFSRPQFLKVLEIVNQVVRECNEFVQKQGYDIKCPDIIQNYGKTGKKYDTIEHEPEPEHDCYLCKSRKGSFKGSHLAPNFLIQPFLSYDHTTKRDKEIVTEIILEDKIKARKWGRSVNPDVIRNQFGEVPDEELTSIKSNALTRDDYFCHECEERFGYYETLYADYFNKRNFNISPTTSYLFWLGVFWRLSVANMCFKMSKEDEEDARHILDMSMSYSINDVRNNKTTDGLGGFCYTILHCSDIKGERRGLIGNHALESPYKLVVGEYIITLYRNRDEVAESFPVNDYLTQERQVELSFIEYWKLKQEIMNETQRHEVINMRKNDSHIIDIAYGGDNDRLERVLNPVGSYIDDMSGIGKREKPKYGIIIPGAIMKVLEYESSHPFDDVEDFWRGFESCYGYKKSDIEAIANEYFDNSKIYRASSEQDRQRHYRRQMTSKKKQKINKKRKNRGKN